MRGAKRRRELELFNGSKNLVYPFLEAKLALGVKLEQEKDRR